MGKYPNSGIIGKNKRKQTDKHPDYSGSAEVNGVEYWISGWKKFKDGEQFLSLAFNPKDGQRAAGEGSQVPQDDDDPF